MITNPAVNYENIAKLTSWGRAKQYDVNEARRVYNLLATLGIPTTASEVAEGMDWGWHTSGEQFQPNYQHASAVLRRLVQLGIVKRESKQVGEYEVEERVGLFPQNLATTISTMEALGLDASVVKNVYANGSTTIVKKKIPMYKSFYSIVKG